MLRPKHGIYNQPSQSSRSNTEDGMGRTEELKEGRECCESAVFRAGHGCWCYSLALSLSAVLIACRRPEEGEPVNTHEDILLLQDLYTINGWW